MQVKFFGTGSCLNELRANLSFWVKDESTLLFDCGERTYHQIKKAGDNPNDIDSIFVSHNHGDHIGGIPTIMFGMDIGKRENNLSVYGPEDIDIQEFYASFYSNLPLKYPVKFERLESSEHVDFGDLTIKTQAADHGLPALMYSIETANLKVFYTGDTQPVDGYIEAAYGADLLIHDCTYLHSEKTGEWNKFSHSSAKEAGYAASRAGARKLALVQMAMFEDPHGNRLKEVMKEAKSEYDGEILIPNDFDTIYL